MGVARTLVCRSRLCLKWEEGVGIVSTGLVLVGTRGGGGRVDVGSACEVLPWAALCHTTTLSSSTCDKWVPYYVKNLDALGICAVRLDSDLLVDECLRWSHCVGCKSLPYMKPIS